MSTTKKPLFLSVMGTMGSGKTTAAGILAQALKFHLVEENFGENAFLPRFYKRMNRWAFHSQTFFLMEKINQLMEIGTELASPPRFQGRSRGRSGIVQDTPIEQDVFSYAKAQHSLRNMDDAEWRLYHKIYASFEPTLPKPDIVIFLETSVEEIVKRIASRGRGYEQKIPKKYLELLEKLNQEWIGRHKSQNILNIQTDGLNIVTSKTAQRELLRLVKKAIGS